MATGRPPWLKALHAKGVFQPDLEKLFCRDGHVWEVASTKRLRSGMGFASTVTTWTTSVCLQCGKKDVRCT